MWHLITNDTKFNGAMNAIYDTSSLVLLWSDGVIHTSKMSKKFLSLLDLDSGRQLLSQCNEVWPHYDQVIKNRKKCILESVLESIIVKEISQVVIFGSGMDALSLEIVSCAKNVTVYEVDIAQMNLKENIIKQIDSTLNNSIKCIGSDITKTSKAIQEIKQNGWDCTKPSIIVFEGISYFLTEKNLWDLVSEFSTSNQANILLLEYLIPEEEISKDRVHIQDHVFGAIQMHVSSGKSQITRYNTNKIKLHLEKIHGEIIQHYTLKDMEKSRTGQNAHFQTSQSGWIEICQIKI